MFNSTERERKRKEGRNNRTHEFVFHEFPGMGFIEFMSSFIFVGPRVRGAERRRERERERQRL